MLVYKHSWGHLGRLQYDVSREEKCTQSSHVRSKVIALDVGGLVFIPGIFLFHSFKQLNGIEAFMRPICLKFCALVIRRFKTFVVNTVEEIVLLWFKTNVSTITKNKWELPIVGALLRNLWDNCAFPQAICEWNALILFKKKLNIKVPTRTSEKTAPCSSLISQ